MRKSRSQKPDISEAFLKCMLDHTIDGIIAVDELGRICFTNKPAEIMFGYSEAEMANQAFVLLLNEKEAYDKKDGFHHFAERTGKEQDIDARHKNGNTFPVSLCFNQVELDSKPIFVGTVIDQTETKRKEQELRHSERSLARSQQVAHMGNWEWDIATDALIWSDEVYRIYGLEPDSIRPSIETFLDTVHPDDREDIMQKMQLGIDEHSEYGSEHRCIRPDGTERIVYSLGQASYDENDKPLYMFGIALDITEQKITAAKLQCYQQELEALVNERTAELRESEHRYRSLVENIPGAAYRCLADDNWTILYISDSVTDITGYPVDDFIDNKRLDWHSLIHPDDLAQTTKAVEDGIASAKPWSIEYRLIHKNGITRWIIETAQALRDDDGKVMYLDGFILDNTERKLAELELSHYREHLEELVQARTVKLNEITQNNRNLFNASPVGLVLCSMDGQFIDVNPSFLKIIGYSEEETKKLTFWDVSPQEQRERDQQALLSLEQHGHFGPMEKEYLTKNGELVPVRISGITIELGGKKYNWSSVENISERKRYELQLLSERERAEAANRSKSDFLAMMSHEIRTPMNAIIGMSELALNTALDKQQQNYIDKVHSSAKNLLVIINDVLDFSKIEAGQLELENIEFSFHTVLEKLTNLIGLRAQEKGLELIYDIPPNLPTIMIGDPTRLTQILVNLGTNAIKFTEQGEITLKVGILKASADRVRLHFEVSDSGIGIETRNQALLFKAFTQANNTVTRQYGGTGLGLSICKRLVDLMHGNIEVESKPGQGSKFYFDIELGQAARESELEPRSNTRLKNRRVLVVDDNNSLRRTLEKTLSQFGLLADSVASGKKAIKALDDAQNRREPYDLVLLDQWMPEMDGIETARQIIDDSGFQTPKLLVMVSAFDVGTFQGTAAEIAFNDLIIKPITPTSLLDSLVNALDRQEPSPSSAPSGLANTSLQNHAELEGREVLLVEDNLVNQELAAEVLSRAGIIVTSALNGEEALEILTQQDFDLILMDIHMPVMDGITATRLIRQNPRYNKLPIVALTANVLQHDRLKYQAAGMDGYLAKPFEIEEILTVLSQCISPRATTTTVEPIPLTNPVNPPDLPRITGLDTDLGLSICQSNPDLYLRVLEIFIDNESFTENCFESLKTGDIKAVSLLARALGNTATNIGAVLVQDESKKLYELCHRNAASEEINAQLQQLDKQLSIIIEGLQQWFKPPAAKSQGNAG